MKLSIGLVVCFALLSLSPDVGAKYVSYTFLGEDAVLEEDDNPATCAYQFSLYDKADDGKVHANTGCGIYASKWDVFDFPAAIFELLSSPPVILDDENANLIVTAALVHINMTPVVAYACPIVKANVELGCGSCSGCGGQSKGGCYCDAECKEFGDCCANQNEICSPKPSTKDTPKDTPCEKKQWCRDKDGDGWGGTGDSESCGPPDNKSVWVANCSDCNDNPASGKAVKDTVTVYKDHDGDGWYGATGTAKCGPPAMQWPDGTTGISTIWTPDWDKKLQGQDCDDNKPNIWQLAVVYSDADGDGYLAGNGIAMCIGKAPAGTALKAPSPDKIDCKDDAVWAHPGALWVKDKDGDKYYATTEAIPICQSTGAYTTKPGDDYHSTAMGGQASQWKPGDCDDGNNEVTDAAHTEWAHDADGDGYPGDYTLKGCLPQDDPESGIDQWIVLPSDKPTDCDDTDPEKNPDTPWYADHDHDGYGGVECGKGCTAQTDLCPTQEESENPLIGRKIDDGVLDKVFGYFKSISGSKNVGTGGIPGAARGQAAAKQEPSKFVTSQLSVRGRGTKPDYVTQGGDCDDKKEEIKDHTQTWYLDVDGDGSGAGQAVGFSCEWYQKKPPEALKWLLDQCKHYYFEAKNNPGPLQEGFTTETSCNLAHAFKTLWVATNNQDCHDFIPEFNKDKKWCLDKDNDGAGDPTQCQICMPIATPALPGPPVPSQQPELHGAFGCVRSHFMLPGCGTPHVANADDCNDQDPLNAGAWHLDADGDGFGDPYTIMCTPPQGEPFVPGTNGFDCDDAEADPILGGPEIFVYADVDGDGFGDPENLWSLCSEAPAPADVVWVDQPNDFNDSWPAVEMSLNIERAPYKTFWLDPSSNPWERQLCISGNKKRVCVPLALLKPELAQVLLREYEFIPRLTLTDLQAFPPSNSPLAKPSFLLSLHKHVVPFDITPSIQVIDPQSNVPFFVVVSPVTDKWRIFAMTEDNLKKGLGICGSLNTIQLTIAESVWSGFSGAAVPFNLATDCLPDDSIVNVHDPIMNTHVSVLLRGGKSFLISMVKGAMDLPYDYYQAIPRATDHDKDLLDDELELVKYGLLTSTDDTDQDGVNDGMELLVAHGDVWPAKESTVKPVIDQNYNEQVVIMPFPIAAKPEWMLLWEVAQQQALAVAPYLWERVLDNIPMELLDPDRTLEEGIMLAEPAYLLDLDLKAPVEKVKGYSPLGLCRDCAVETVSIQIDVKAHLNYFADEPVGGVVDWSSVQSAMTNTFLHEALHYILNFEGLGGDFADLEHDYIDTILLPTVEDLFPA